VTDEDRSNPTAQGPPLQDPLSKRSLALVLSALLLWLLQMVGHGHGGKIAAKAFEYFGRERGELYCIIGVIIAFSLGFLWALKRILQLRSLAGTAKTAQRRVLALWFFRALIWLASAVLVERVFIALHSELYHYVQYGFIAFLLFLAIRRSDRVLILGLTLGAVDELHQLLTLYQENPAVYFDWNDVLLNLLGTAGGTLIASLFVADLVITEQKTGKQSRTFFLIGATGALIGALSFTIPWQPFWTTWIFENQVERLYHKVQWGEGLFLLSASTVALLSLLNPRLNVRGSVLLALATGLAVMPVALSFYLAPKHEEPPLPSIHVVQSSGPINIDGQLTEETWSRVQPLHFSRLRTNQKANFSTQVYLAWDTENLYVAFRASDSDILGTPRKQDDPTLPAGEVVELFLDPTGLGKEYLEIEVNPANAVYDLLVRTQVPIPGKPYSWFDSDPTWNVQGLETAVSIDGTLSQKGGAWDNDAAWIVEMKLPFAALPPTMQAPNPETRWRANFFRVDRPRQRTAELTCWSPSMSESFHQTPRFGTLIFSKKRGRIRTKQ
jgi:hypothetical protein